MVWFLRLQMAVRGPCWLQEKEKRKRGEGGGRDLANIKAKSSQARQCTSQRGGSHVVEVLTVRRWRRLHIDRTQNQNTGAVFHDPYRARSCQKYRPPASRKIGVGEMKTVPIWGGPNITVGDAFANLSHRNFAV